MTFHHKLQDMLPSLSCDQVPHRLLIAAEGLGDVLGFEPFPGTVDDCETFRVGEAGLGFSGSLGLVVRYAANDVGDGGLADTERLTQRLLCLTSCVPLPDFLSLIEADLSRLPWVSYFKRAAVADVLCLSADLQVLDSVVGGVCVDVIDDPPVGDFSDEGLRHEAVNETSVWCSSLSKGDGQVSVGVAFDWLKNSPSSCAASACISSDSTSTADAVVWETLDFCPPFVLCHTETLNCKTEPVKA